MTATEHADALAEYIAESGWIRFREMNEFLESRGVSLDGDGELLGQHVRQPHVSEGTTLLGPVSEEYVQIVEALFTTYPVMLMIGDMADFAGCGDEPWWVTWIGGRHRSGDGATLPRRPPVNRDVHDMADRAKHGYATGTRVLAEMQYRLAELAGSGQLDAAESMELQKGLVNVWESLYTGTLSAVTDRDTPDSTWDAADNTYSDGRRVIHQVRIEPWESSDQCWEHNPFMLGDGAPNEFPLGTISYIAPMHAEDPPGDQETDTAIGSLQERLKRYRGD
jgi:hypothetical protein